MDEKECQKAIEQIYLEYHEVIAPFVIELEVRDTEYPVEILNEIRAIFTHISRYELYGATDNITSAERHVQRAVLDCYKYLCISIAERIKNFRNEYKGVDLKLADNGKFLPDFDRLESVAKASYIEAKRAEIVKKDDDSLFELYEVAYNYYSELDKFLDSSNEAILFACSHSKKISLITYISFAVGILGFIATVISLLQ